MPLLRGNGRKQEDPNRFTGNQQRSQAGGNFLFGPVQRTVANEKEEDSNNDAGTDVRPSRTQAPGQAPGEKNGACKQMPEARGGKRRYAFDCITNGQIGGSPDEVNGEETKDNRNAVLPPQRTRGDRGRSFSKNDANLVSGHLLMNMYRRYAPGWGESSAKMAVR